MFNLIGVLNPFNLFVSLNVTCTCAGNRNPIMNRISKILGLYDSSLPIENKVFNMVSITAFFTNLLFLVFNLALGLSWVLNILVSALAVVSLTVFYFSRFRKIYDKLVLPYLIFGLLSLFPVWFYSGGIEGSTLAVFIFLMSLGLLLVQKKNYVVFMITVLFSVTGLFLLEDTFPNLVVPYNNQETKHLDILASGLVILFIMGLLVTYFKRSYDIEHKELIKNKKQLEDSQEHYIKARQAAEAATLAKSQFLANMSHEIRTPLNGIIGTTELLLQDRLTTSQKELIQTMQESSNLLLEIIHDILDISKIEADKIDLKISDFCLANTIKTVIAISAPRIGSLKKNIHLRYSIDSGVAKFVQGDEGRLKQILLNLVGNAIKFTSEGEILLLVKAKTIYNNKQLISFSIKDTGIGISSSHLDVLFQPFMQIDSAATRKYGGTGLGLSICKKLVDLMGGSITAESVEGRGSIFRFEIPYRIIDNVPEKKLIEKTDSMTNLTTSKILVAEDNSMNQLIITRLFESIGCKIDLAENGKQALAMAKQTTYDFIFMDIQMPEMDGLEAARRILQSHTADSAPIIIAMTANAMKEDEEMCLAAGMKDFISKPVFLETLKGTLKKWMKIKEGNEPMLINYN
jgi:signal transduction histidine kinase/CheY-like chemotaxis protein